MTKMKHAAMPAVQSVCCSLSDSSSVSWYGFFTPDDDPFRRYCRYHGLFSDLYQHYIARVSVSDPDGRRFQPDTCRRQSQIFPCSALLTGAVINTILDPLFIFGFDMGMAGAALATIIGQIVSSIMVIVYFTRFKTVHLTLKSLIPSFKYCRGYCGARHGALLPTSSP